ncbi:peptidase S8 [Deinococcus koreensis]|uniref:Peptidase S8 n=1 Tax=Deinococcus koreensis TaxID=2054903 RepID=A0A2K3V216_9DEIO|nr:peptidase S8 [Deinococcus koreensis]
MTSRLAWPLLSLTLVLTACPAPPTPPVVVCPQGLSSLAADPAGQSAPGAEPGAVLRALAATVPGAVDWDAPHVPGEVLVIAGGAGTSGLSAQGLAALSGVRTQGVLGSLSRAFTPAGETDQAFAARLAAAGLRVQPNFVYRALATPNDPGFPGNGGVTIATGSGDQQVTQTYLTRIRAPQAWNFLAGCGKTPVGAKTAVVDSALDAGHVELNGRIAEQASFLNVETGTTTNVHATAAAGAIGAATNNGKGLAGVSWNVPLMSVEVLGTSGTTTAVLARGLNYAVEKGARVINMSLGGARDPSKPTDPGDSVLNSALSAAAKSAVLVAAAGNTAQDGVYYPASHPDVLAVGALGNSDTALACYSARPNTVFKRALDVVAPGGAGYGRCPGTTATQDMLLLAPEDQYELAAGTSFSAPLVSGVVALMRAANPGLSAAQTRTLLLSSLNKANKLPMLDAEAAVRAATR